MKWFRTSRLHSSMRSDGGLQINASNWLQQNRFCAFGAQLNSESHTAEGWENPPHPREKTLSPWVDTLQPFGWLKPTLCVQDDTECTCVFGFLFSTCEKHSRGEDNAPTLAKMRSFVSGLLRRTHHFPDQRQRGCIQEPMRFIMLLYI